MILPTGAGGCVTTAIISKLLSRRIAADWRIRRLVAATSGVPITALKISFRLGKKIVLMEYSYSVYLPRKTTFFLGLMCVFASSVEALKSRNELEDVWR